MTELLDSGLLGLTVVAALVGAIGSLIGLVLKDVFFARSFERWKTGQELRRVYVRYTNPIFLAANDLCNRLEEILKWHPASYLDTKHLGGGAKGMRIQTASDPYFQRYKLLSTIYRFCSFLGWLELFRQEIVFLERGRSPKNRTLEKKLEAIRSDLADGQLNTAADWIQWYDRLLFREEQRAIGEKMILRTPGTATVMGYAEFCEKLEESKAGDQNRWFHSALSFFANPSSAEKDFHLIRLKRLIVHLVELMMELDKSRVRDIQKEWCARLSSELQL